MLTPAENVSPFDVNMAADAGFDIVVPYHGVTVEGVTALVQDAIFSRPPKRFNETAVFIGGYDVTRAADMLSAAKAALVPPFEIGLFADPNGAYTTSAALLALVKHHLEKRSGEGLEGRNVQIYGGGPVGLCTAVLVAQQGGRPLLVRLTEMTPDKERALKEFGSRYGVDLPWVAAPGVEDKADVIASAHVVITSAKAGIRVLPRVLLDMAPDLVVAADVNAVPPGGIEGVEAGDNAVQLAEGTETPVGIGALAIGNVKYQVQHKLLKVLQEASEPAFLDLPDAFRLATELV